MFNIKTGLLTGFNSNSKKNSNFTKIARISKVYSCGYFHSPKLDIPNQMFTFKDIVKKKNVLVFQRLEKAMAPHSSTLAWKLPWTEEPGRLQSMGSKKLDTTERIHFHFLLSCIGEGNGNPLQCSCLENPRDGGAWWAAVYGVTQSRTRLKRLSSSSS